MKLFLSPHNDDETLFGAFTLMRERPHVIVCLRSFVQSRYGITYQQRENETAAAMKVLGCTWEQWQIPDNAPDWARLEAALRKLEPQQVWAPLPEENGHAHHNRIGEITKRLWPHAVQYLTYTTSGKSSKGTLVPFGPSMVNVKLQALQCYSSQILEPSCTEHFVRDQREYCAS